MAEVGKKQPGRDASMDVKSIRERHGRHLERLEALARKVRQKRAGAYEAAIRHAELHPPSVSSMKSSPEVLKRALSRGQVRRIARVASKTSKDTEGLFTAGGARYAVTDLYKPTARERVGLLRERATKRAGGFWEEHKMTFVLGAVGLTALYLLYVTAARAQERGASRPAPRGRHLSGFHRAALPAHAVGWWPEEHLLGGSDRTSWEPGRWPSEHYRDLGEEFPWEHRHQEQGWWPGEHHHFTGARSRIHFAIGDIVVASANAPLFKSDAPMTPPFAASGADGQVKIVGLSMRGDVNPQRRLYQVVDVDHPEAGAFWIEKRFLMPMSAYESLESVATTGAEGTW